VTRITRQYTKSFRARKVWLYMVDGRNSDDLAILDSRGFDRWRGNPGTRAGDLIVMYRSAPFSDIAYVFVAASNAWATPGEKGWPWKYAVEIADGFRLQRVIKLDELKRNPALIEACRIPRSLPFQATTLIGADRAMKANRFALILRSAIDRRG